MQVIIRASQLQVSYRWEYRTCIFATRTRHNGKIFCRHSRWKKQKVIYHLLESEVPFPVINCSFS